MTGLVLVCKCCGQPLQVVCPTHGTSTVAASWPDHLTPPAPAEVAPRRRVRPLREQLLSLLSNPPGRVMSLTMIAGSLSLTNAHAGVVVNELAKAGRVERVGRGLYRRVEAAA